MSGAAAGEQNAGSLVASPVPQDLYRILMLRKKGSELLVAGERPRHTLPYVEIPKWERVAENLIAAVRKHYGLSAICLFTPEMSSPATDRKQPSYQVMETRECQVGAPDERCWLPVNPLLDQSFPDQQDSAAIRQMLRQLAEFQRSETVALIGRPGWIEDLNSWVQHVIEPSGLRLNGELLQLNAGTSFALLRLGTNGQALWFKAVGEPNLRELRISVTLSNLFPGFVPTVIATHPTCDGWLTSECPGSALDDPSDDYAWQRVAEELAGLQIASLGKADQLLDAGCRNLRITSLLPLIDPFMDAMSRLMEQQTKTLPRFLTKNELLALGTQIKEALSEMAELDIPDSLGHLDLNPGNVLCSADQCFFLDWAEGYVGPPFLTLEYLRAHQARLRRKGPTSSSDIVHPYETKWRGILSQEAVSAGLRLAPVLAAFAYASATDVWRNPASLGESGTGAAYLRSLTRRMRDEMLRLNERRQPCRN